MPSNRKSPCRECRTPTRTRSGICHGCDPPSKQKKLPIVHRAASHGGVVHAVYERWADGGTIARCGAKFVCGKVDDVPIRMISCVACKLKARRFGKLERDG